MIKKLFAVTLLAMSVHSYAQTSEQKVVVTTTRTWTDESGVAVTSTETREFVENAPAAEERSELMPQIHGVLRTRYEGEFTSDEYSSRFQVRNARMSLEGRVMPQLDWYVRVDFCDCGSFKFLDAWGRWKFGKAWAVKMGRFRVPFGVDAFRGPGTYYFANRSFIGKNMANLRQVGLQGGYYGASHMPLSVEAGVFNSAAGSSHDVWQKGFDYAAKASYRLGNVSLSASFLSMNPYGVRQNIWDAAVTYKYDRLLLSTEYQRLDYAGRHACDDVNSYLAYAVYTIPLCRGAFNQWNWHARFDGMDDHSKGKINEGGMLSLDDASRRRLTLGTTLACAVKGVKSELLFDYEKYWFDRGVVRPFGMDNRIVAELVVKF